MAPIISLDLFGGEGEGTKQSIWFFLIGSRNFVGITLKIDKKQAYFYNKMFPCNKISVL